MNERETFWTCSVCGTVHAEEPEDGCRFCGLAAWLAPTPADEVPLWLAAHVRRLASETKGGTAG